MKTFYTSLFIAFFSFVNLQAQQVEIIKKKNRIGEDLIEGHVSIIIGNEDKIEKEWYKELRTLGRLREEGNYLTVKEATFENWGEKTLSIYSKLMATDSLTEIWVTWKENELNEDSVKLVNDNLQQLLYNFSLNYYKNRAQEKVDEAERAVAFTEKKKQKLEAEAIELEKDLVDNTEEIKRLKLLLEKNELEEKVISQKIIDNKADQDTTLIDIERLKRVVEQKKMIKEAIE